ncbi:NAD(P)/FAD-dependent oxidoreductase [Nocardioides sp.]|uniref:NAD(P)/FAD-dependent oxidoreductase n=1 Tax=Nocardioides sp. TaxID=35761 RepID=UPI00273587EA|nr:NAD(P)/FAD-dependent oxidoreductase [Nocardioides sp.]MDP3890846.1 NAD(P)/FAD-dependent oxidoreductase [Nocardioides sp.]
MDTHYDAIVVGARVAGASTAMLLARAGARVALIDRSRHGSDTLSTHGLMRAGVLQLARWGVLEEVVAAGTPAIGRTLFHYGGEETVQVSIRPSPGVQALYAPRRHLLDRILVGAAAASGVDVAHDVAVTGVLTDHGRVEGVTATTGDHRRLKLRSRLVIGADGIRSTVASAVGAPVVRRGRSGGAVLYRYYAGLETAGYEWAYGDGAAAGMIPTNDGLTCVFVATDPGRMRELRRDGTEAAFDALLGLGAPDQRHRVDAATAGGRIHGWGGLPGFVREAAGPGWALVGDAGYFRDPITTHGMTDAMRDAELLATAVLAGWGGRVTESAALRDYQLRRDALSASLFDATDRIAAYDWDPSTIRQLLRRVSSAMTDEVELLEGLPTGPDQSPARRILPGQRESRDEREWPWMSTSSFSGGSR